MQIKKILSGLNNEGNREKKQTMEVQFMKWVLRKSAFHLSGVALEFMR